MEKVKKVTLSGMLFAIGLILPFFIGQIRQLEKCSCHERLEAYYDLKVFLTIDPIEQIQRIEKRNGSEKAVEFQKKWIPLEELYFEKCRTRSRCDVCFTMCDEM